jgi:hypothetical protein
MTGVMAPAGVLGASLVITHAKLPAGAALGAHLAEKTLPFTGAALTIYLAFGISLVLAGIALRTFGKVRG